MFAGHFALAAAVKAKQPGVPLWALMLSTQLLDVIFVPLYVSGVETMEPVVNGYGGALIHADYTHSLVGALLIALAAGFLALRAWNKRSGIVIAAMVFSHWLLDLLVHRSDLPILPGNLGNLPLLGFGLWKWPAVSISLEAALIILGSILYFRSALSRANATRDYQINRKSKSRAILAGVVMGGLLILSLLSDVMGIG